MSSRHFARAFGGCALVALIGITAGCGPNYKARAIVKGKVTFDGKNLTTGNVVFHGAKHLQGSGAIDKDGNYVINDAPIGEVAITVFVPKAPPGGIARMKSGPGMKGKDAGKSVDPEGSGRSISIMGEMPTNIVPIPDKFAVPENSGLKYTVVKGEQTHDIVLRP